MPRFLNGGFRILFDLGVMSAAYWLSWMFRFEFRLPPMALEVALWTWPSILVVQYLALSMFGVPRMAWRYLNIRDAVRVGFALTAATCVVAVIRVAHALPFTENVVPWSVIIMDYVLAYVGLVGIRATWRVHNEVQNRRKRTGDGNIHRVLLIGAGEAGVIVAREIVNRPYLNLMPVGFLDDNPQ